MLSIFKVLQYISIISSLKTMLNDIYNTNELFVLKIIKIKKLRILFFKRTTVFNLREGSLTTFVP